MLPMGVLATEEVSETSELTTTEPESEEQKMPEDAPLSDVLEPITESKETVEPTPLMEDLPMSGTCGDNLTWTLEKGTLTISGNGAMSDFKYFNGSSSPFYLERSNIETVIIQDGVTYIGDAAFWQCYKLTSIIIPNSITGIGNYAFYRCSNLRTVLIPSSVTNIKLEPFLECTNLTEIIVEPDNENYCSSKDGVLFNKKQTDLITCPAGKSGSYNIPDTVTRIRRHAFDGCKKITNITIPNCVTNIEAYAFSGCENITDIVIPDSVTNVEEYAFSGCTALVSVMLSTNMSSIENNTFQSCKNLRCIYIPNNITRIGVYALNDCPLKCICYSGNKDDWDSIKIDSANSILSNADLLMCYNCPKADYQIFRNNGYEIFDRSLEMCMFKTDSSEYNPQLAHMLIAMCNSVHNSTDMKNTFESFGFDKTLRADLLSLTFSVGIKKDHTNKPLVLIVARGTKDIEEWISNVDFKANDKGLHSGFYDAAKEVYNETISFLNKNDIDISKAAFIITGHSRGAAVANILTARFVKVESKNIYTYTFACPDVAVIQEDLAHSYKNIFNIGNVKDYVSWIPRAILSRSGEKDGWGKDSYWDKYGQSFWYCEDWDDYHELKTNVLGISTFHGQDKYLEYLRSEKPTSEYKKRNEASSALDEASDKRHQEEIKKRRPNIGGRRVYVGVFCPVDVEIYTSNGQLAGTVIDNTPNEILPDKVYIDVVGDKKTHIFA